MKTHIITVSRRFPKTHKHATQETFFIEKILAGLPFFECSDIIELFNYADNDKINSCREKIDIKVHTIRQNYELWKKRIDEVNQGIAILSIRAWKGVPRKSKQFEICHFTKSSGIHVQKIQYTPQGWRIDDNDGRLYSSSEIAPHDGLSVEDFEDWFKDIMVPNTPPMAIIHFSPKRY